MNEEVIFIIDTAKEAMQKAVDHLTSELGKIRAGKANPSMLDGIMVDYYGTQTPLNQMANVNTPDPRTIVIQPWEKALLDDISNAIINSNLGLNPQNNGDVIILSLPPLTEERRKELVKRARAEAEHAKVGIRTARKEANDEVKVLEKDGLSEDEARRAEDQIQEVTKEFTERCDSIVDRKEKDIMTV
jgi:ribosome recycling factor